MLGIVAGVLLQSLFALSFSTVPSSFPKPLSPDEEEKYIAELFEGSENARNILIEHNLRLVAHIVKKYSNCGMEADDLISIGTIGLIKAVSTFVTDKNIRLATYAARCIENEVLMALRRNKKLQNEVSLSEPLGIDKTGSEIQLIDILSTDEEDIPERLDLKNQLKELYNNMRLVLQGRERTVLEMRYGLYEGKEHTQREIAKVLGISRSYVSRIEKKAIKKLQNIMR